MEPADGTGLLPLNFLLLGVGVWNFLGVFSAGFASDLVPVSTEFPEVNTTRGAHYPLYTHV